jgi:hypothetical protein
MIARKQSVTRILMSAFALLTFVSLALSSPSGASVNEASTQTGQTQAWMGQITNDYSQLDFGVQNLLQIFQEWSTKGTSAQSVTAVIDEELSPFAHTIHALMAQKPLPWTKPALLDYQAGAELYLAAIRVERVASLLESGSLQSQLQESELRIRELGDKVYNLAGDELAKYLPTPATDPNVVVIAPSPVPNFSTEQLLPGPPLDRKSDFTAVRPIHATSLKAAVKEALIPSADTETKSIRSGSLVELRTLSDEFLRDSTALADAPPPGNDTAVRNGVRLSLLVASEATRTAEGARVVTAAADVDPLKRVAQDLALISDSLWDPALGSRSVGFSASSLNDTGP